VGHALNACRHCGLAASAHGDFCCYGCELADRLLHEDADEQQRTAGVLTLSLVLTMSVMMLSLFLYAEDIYEPTSNATFAWLRQAYRYGAAILATPVMLLLGIPLLRRAARAGRLTMELLIAVGAFAAWWVSVVGLVRGGTAVYFDSAVAALTLATFGRYLEAKARCHASKLVGRLLEPSIEPVLAAQADGTLRRTAPTDIQPGMVVEVPPGATVPVDLVVHDDGKVSLAVVTGESEPVVVAAGDEVPAGAIVLDRDLRGAALRVSHESTLERLAAMVRDLHERRGRPQRVADQLAAWMLPLVAIAACAAFAYWTTVEGMGRGIDVALAVVLVACPCTYAVVTPLISWLTLRKALHHGVCIRDAEVIDAMASVRGAAFDKTGTLTEPTLAGEASPDVFSLVNALERDLPHPIARSLRGLARGHDAASLSEREVVDGGVRGRDAAGRELLLGSARLMARTGITTGDDAEVYLAVDGEVVATFVVSECVRLDAPAAIDALRHDGIDCIILSGDHAARVQHVANQLDVEARAGMTAADKLEALQALSDTALIGDGANDAPAAAAASVSFAVDNATSLQRGAADVVMLTSNLRLVPWSLALARRATRSSYQALAAATIYNVCLVSVAAAGLLRPVLAGLSMIAASLIALASAQRIAMVDDPCGTATIDVAEAAA
jgi:Cu2+-exporting ATPase